MTGELISVIVPVYNVEKYLERSVNSLLAQTYTEFEIILVDDGSTDSGGALCDSIKERDGRIRVLHKKNGGLSSARNAGLKVAEGKYVAFVDSDDVVSPDYLLKLYSAMTAVGADMAMCGKAVFKGDEDIIPEKSTLIDVKEITYRDYMRDVFTNHDTYIPTWNKLYKKFLFDGIKFPEGKLHEDTFTTYLCVKASNKVAVISDKLYYYFYNEEGIAHSRFSARRFDDVEAHLNIFAELKRLNLTAALTQASMWFIDYFIKVLSYKKTDVIDYIGVKRETKRRYMAVRRKLLKEGKLRPDWRVVAFLSALNIKLIKLHRNFLNLAYGLCKRNRQ